MIPSDLGRRDSYQVRYNLSCLALKICFFAEFLDQFFHLQCFRHFLPVCFLTVGIGLDDDDLPDNLIFFRCCAQLDLRFVYTRDFPEAVHPLLNQLKTAFSSGMSSQNIIFAIPFLDQEWLQDSQYLNGLF